jgi:hypothetical protein
MKAMRTRAEFECQIEQLRSKHLNALMKVWKSMDKVRNTLVKRLLSDNGDEIDEQHEDISDLHFDLGETIARTLNPATVGDIQKFTADEGLRSHMLAYLIERDGPRKFTWEEITDLVEWTLEEEILAIIDDPASAKFSGLDLIEWIENTSDEAEPTTAAAPIQSTPLIA